MPQSRSDPDPPGRRPLPVAITPGMPVVEVLDGMPGTVVGLTQEYCIYRSAASNVLGVARWREMALGNVCPVEPLLPEDVTERDRDNASAAVLRELLQLRQFGLTESQSTVLDELVAALTDA